MRRIITFLILFSFIASPICFQAGRPQLALAWAKFPDDLPGPHLMPDSKLYFLKIWYEKLVIFFTFDLVKKAEKYKVFAEKRAYEAEEMIKKGKQDLANKQEELYKYYLRKAQETLERAIQKAMRHGREELQQELEKKVEEIKNKLKESFKIW